MRAGFRKGKALSSRVSSAVDGDEDRLGDADFRFTAEGNLDALKTSYKDRYQKVIQDIARLRNQLGEAPQGRAREHIQLRLDNLEAEKGFYEHQLSRVGNEPWALSGVADGSKRKLSASYLLAVH